MGGEGSVGGREEGGGREVWEGEREEVWEEGRGREVWEGGRGGEKCGKGSVGGWGREVWEGGGEGEKCGKREEGGWERGEGGRETTNLCMMLILLPDIQTEVGGGAATERP